MNAVSQWVFSLCAAMVAAGMLHMLMPRAGMEKVMRLVVSVFFLCSLFSPAIFNVPELVPEGGRGADAEIEERSRRVTEVADEQALEAFRLALEEQLTEKLSQRGIKVHTLTINIIPKGQNAAPVLDTIFIAARGDGEEAARMEAELKAELGVPVSITVG